MLFLIRPVFFINFYCLFCSADVLKFKFLYPDPASSVADPYHFGTDPDPGCEKICSGSESRQKRYGSVFGPGHKRIEYPENLKNVIKTFISHVLCAYIT